MVSRRSVLKSSLATGITRLLSGDAVASGGGAGADGFRYVDEAAQHERTFMQWPVNRTVHDDPEFLAWLHETIAGVANAISEFEPVVMLAARDHHRTARAQLSSGIELWDVPTDDLWCRDSGPHFVSNGLRLAVSQLNFNGWGGKQEHGHDALVAGRVAAKLGLPVFNNGVVGEAGGVEANGHGLLLAHESSWINPNRNNGSRDAIDALLLDAYGGRKIIWAPGIIGADITDYHIDSLARLIDERTVLIQMPRQADTGDPWSVAAFETLTALRAATALDGGPLAIEMLPEPAAIRQTDADFVAAYPNYYVCNGAVIGAAFGDAEADSECAAVLKRLYPGREIVQLDIDAIGLIGGGIHCATHEQPKV
jgi:agmatine deiminase